MIHTKECDTYIARTKEEIEKYVKKWPNYCSSCHGAGGFYSPGSYWQPPDFDICDNCVGKGKCPRCGAESFVSEDSDIQICSSCQFDLNKDQGMPENGECTCWVDEDVDPQ